MGKLFILRHFIVAAVFSILSSHSALAIDLHNAANDASYEATENNPTPEDPEKLIAAPIVLKGDEENSAAAGAVVVEPTPQPENALDILREEMRTLQSLEHEKQQRDGWFVSTNKRFAPESMTFFVAIGLVTYNSMWIKSHGDPLAMERHILSLKDPIAHLSFYAFMVANGFYINLRSKNMDPLTKAQMMRRLSYQGMAVGSLASSIVADLGHSGKMCVDYWIMGRNDEKSIAACNGAWKHWTVRNKFQQYFPQIMAMWASQAATEIIDANARKSFTKITSTNVAKKFLQKKVLVNFAKKITGADVAITFAGGTFSMKVLRWVGKVTQFTMFVAVDHAMSPYTYRPLNNIIRPVLFDIDSLAINNYISAADQINWDDQRLPEANKQVCSVRNPNCLEKRIVEEIESFSSQMQQWREHLNSDAELDISGWMELTKKLLNQLDYSYKFYKSFVSNFFQTLNIGSRIRSGELQKSAATNISLFPFRKLPLYGVGIGEYKTTGGNVEDLYLLATSELERKQKEHVLTVANAAEKAAAVLNGADLQKFKSIIEKLKSDDVNTVGNGLVDINQILEINSLQDPSNKSSLYSKDFKSILGKLRKIIGNPMPIVYPFAGFTQAFSANAAMSAIAPDADFSLWSLNDKYMFNKEADLMTYKIFCGPEQGNLTKRTFRLFGLGEPVNMISPQFNPPRLLKKSADLDKYCAEWRKTRELKIFSENLYGQKIGEYSMSNFFMNNFNFNIIGDYRNQENEHVFEKWWLENGRKSLDSEFKAFDEKFKKLVEITRKNIFDQKGFYSWFVDHLNQSKYLKSNIKENLQFETNFYLQVIARALDKSAVQPLSNKFSYLEQISKASTNDRFNAVSGAKNLPELQKVIDLFNSYYLFILQDNVNFDQYIAHSKKIDAAINDLLVLAGLKVSSKNDPELTSAVNKNEVEDAEVGLLDFSMDAADTATVNATPSATGTETSPVTYRDVAVKPNLRQKAITASVQGLRAVESEIRRFIRMKVALAQGLELDTKEFMEDWNNTTSDQNRMSAPVKANPFGQRSGG